MSVKKAIMLEAVELGWLDWSKVLLEPLTAVRRAGDDLIWTYAAVDAAVF